MATEVTAVSMSTMITTTAKGTTKMAMAMPTTTTIMMTTLLVSVSSSFFFSLNTYLPGDCWQIHQKEGAQKAVFFAYGTISLLALAYVVLYPGALQYITIKNEVQEKKAKKHNSTMVSAASPRAANPKMVESPVSMAHAFSLYACAEDVHCKHPCMLIIVKDNWSDSSGFLVGFGISGHLIGY